MSRRFLLLLAGLLLDGCATPKEINGRKVLHTLWQDGRIVYVLEEDKAAKQKAREADEAAREIVFKPLPPARAFQIKL
jgi:hypothetical protein